MLIIALCRTAAVEIKQGINIVELKKGLICNLTIFHKHAIPSNLLKYMCLALLAFLASFLNFCPSLLQISALPLVSFSSRRSCLCFAALQPGFTHRFAASPSPPPPLQHRGRKIEGRGHKERAIKSRDLHRERERERG